MTSMKKATLARLQDTGRLVQYVPIDHKRLNYASVQSHCDHDLDPKGQTPESIKFS